MSILGSFLEHCTISPSGCWEWDGYTQEGYGIGHYRGKLYRAPRIAYELFTGVIPAGLHIDHLCRNRKCVNPKHLEAVTCADNLRRGNYAYLYGTCGRGHPLDEANARWRTNGSWNCRQCQKEWYQENRKVKHD
jgi:hypothetical protein